MVPRRLRAVLCSRRRQQRGQCRREGRLREGHVVQTGGRTGGERVSRRATYLVDRNSRQRQPLYASPSEAPSRTPTSGLSVTAPPVTSTPHLGAACKHRRSALPCYRRQRPPRRDTSQLNHHDDGSPKDAGRSPLRVMHGHAVGGNDRAPGQAIPSGQASPRCLSIEEGGCTFLPLSSSSSPSQQAHMAPTGGECLPLRGLAGRSGPCCTSVSWP